MVKESVVQKRLMDAIEEEFPGVYLRKIHQSRYSHAGIPDLLGCIDGFFFAIEVKKTDGSTTKLQDRELKLIYEAGGLALICSGTDEIRMIINELRVQIQEAL